MTKKRILGHAELPYEYVPMAELPTSVDSTPDADYPIRILEAMLERCTCGYYTGDGPLPELMNKWDAERAVYLRRAIETLRREELAK